MTVIGTESMLLAMALDTTIKVERALRERIRTAAQAQNLTVNEFLTRLMKDYERRDRMARAAAAMKSASPEVMAAISGAVRPAFMPRTVWSWMNW